MDRDRTFPEVQRIDPEDVHRRLGAGESILVVDVRSPEAHTSRRIAGAVSAAARQIIRGVHDLPRAPLLVLY